MHASILQLNRLAILLDDADTDLVRLEPNLRTDTIHVIVDGKLHIIDRDGHELPIPRELEAVA